MRPRTPQLDPGKQAALRAWLRKNHTRSSGVWLAIYKKGAEPNRLRYEEAVEEALCFGWIDGQLRPLDAARFLIWFSPRKARSVWAESNKRRVRKLIREGRMHAAGLAKVAEAKRSGEWQASRVREDTDLVPPIIARALARRKGALARFRQLTPSRRKMFAYWITSARREETTRARIQRLLEFLDAPDAGLPWEPAGQRKKK
ncbi:MAG TPA: YdeI/OmpD-associated family protein [Anaerolineales bacterium]|nr:YdeI/OmpD-associated family protein [Anaerolineales bacterium]